MATRRVPADYPTIQAAVDDAQPGDLIQIVSSPAGTVRVTVNNLTFDAPASVTGITLDARGAALVTLAGASAIHVITDNGYSNTDDVVVGNAGANLINVGGGSDSVTGGDGNDTIRANNGLEDFGEVDTLQGGDGDDTFALWGSYRGGGTVDGGTGLDTVSSRYLDGYTFTNVEVLDTNVNSSSRMVYASVAQLNTFSSIIDSAHPTWQIEITLRGNGGTIDFSNKMTGGQSVRVFAGSEAVTVGFNITGSAGHDNFIGSNADDTLNGGRGRDSFSMTAGIDRLDGGAGNDTFYTSFWSDETGHFEGGAGIDQVYYGFLGNYTFSGVEILEGSATDIFASAAQLSSFKTIVVSKYNFDKTTIYLRGEGGSLDLTTRIGGAVGVTIIPNSVSAGVNVTGSVNADGLLGSGFNDTLKGGLGDDTFITSGGTDILSGGGGDDSFRMIAVDPGGTVSGGDGTDTVLGNRLGSVSFTDVERLDVNSKDFSSSNVLDATAAQLSSFASILDSGRTTTQFHVHLRGAGGLIDFTSRITGSDSVVVDAVQSTAAVNIAGTTRSDVLSGSRFDDTLRGGAADDTLAGGLGADALVGGDGTDYARYNEAAYGNLVINLWDASLNSGAAAAGDTYLGVEGVWSGSGHDTITGDGVRNFLSGGGGNDRVFGGGGADLLSGGSGSDTLAGGAGADEHTGGVGIDYAAYNDADWGNLLISLDNPTLNTGVAAGDTYVSIEGVIGGIGNDTIYGTARTDYLFGGSGNDQLFGGSGNDRLDGGDGADVLYGGAGADQYVGGVGAGVDYARYDDANWGDLLISLINPALNSGAAAGDTYVSIEGIIGGRGSDTIFGDAARNVLQGGSGNDIIDGLDGSDVLVGQVGADRFNFSAALGATNVDTINGFEHGIDKIQLSRAIFKGVGPALDAPEFGTVPGAGKLIVYNQATGELSFDAGGAGAGADAVVFAIVANKVALDIHDFVMIA